MKLKRLKNFLVSNFETNENYHPGTETIIRELDIDEINDLENNDELYGATAAEMNLVDIILSSDDLHGLFEEGKLKAITMFNDSHIKPYTEISLFYILPDYRDKGLAKMLLTYISDHSIDGKLILNPYTDESEQFFLSQGFVKDEEIDPNDTNTLIKNK